MSTVHSRKILATGANGRFKRRKAGKTDYSQALADSKAALRQHRATGFPFRAEIGSYFH